MPELLEAEGHRLEETELGVRRLDEGVRDVRSKGRLDAGKVTADLSRALDERGGARVRTTALVTQGGHAGVLHRISWTRGGALAAQGWALIG